MMWLVNGRHSSDSAVSIHLRHAQEWGFALAGLGVRILGFRVEGLEDFRRYHHPILFQGLCPPRETGSRKLGYLSGP